MKAPSERAPLGKYAGGVLELNAKKPRNKRFRGKKRADNGNRTRLSSLGSWRSTDELYLRMLCILHLYIQNFKHVSYIFQESLQHNMHGHIMP